VVAEARQGKFSNRVVQTSGRRVLRVVDQPMRGGGWVATFDDVTEWQKAQAQIS
jgi:hypothetical protein